MAWQEKNTVTLRQEFVELASQEGANVRALCRRFEISPKTGYKWLARWSQAAGDVQALQEHSRRPRSSPTRSAACTEQSVVELRQRHPAWGGRKIAWVLGERGQTLAPSTVTHILHRHGLISPQAQEQHKPWQRFEHDRPNSLWQIDFKGQFPTLAGPCHALTLLDDHSRFNLLLHANARTTTEHVRPLLVQTFLRYGLPTRINADNGPPWGSPSGAGVSLSELSVWLIRLGVQISFSAPYHPQTNGKIERFHRSLHDEVLAGRHFVDHASAQRALDTWRDIYNCQRPHEALNMHRPVQRYQPSPIAFPQQLHCIEYASCHSVATVNSKGLFYFHGRKLQTSKALAGQPLALQANPSQDGIYEVYFCHHHLMTIDLRSHSFHT